MFSPYGPFFFFFPSFFALKFIPDTSDSSECRLFWFRLSSPRISSFLFFFFFFAQPFSSVFLSVFLWRGLGLKTRHASTLCESSAYFSSMKSFPPHRFFYVLVFGSRSGMAHPLVFVSSFCDLLLFPSVVFLPGLSLPYNPDVKSS